MACKSVTSASTSAPDRPARPASGLSKTCADPTPKNPVRIGWTEPFPCRVQADPLAHKAACSPKPLWRLTPRLTGQGFVTAAARRPRRETLAPPEAVERPAPSTFPPAHKVGATEEYEDPAIANAHPPRPHRLQSLRLLMGRWENLQTAPI